MAAMISLLARLLQVIRSWIVALLNRQQAPAPAPASTVERVERTLLNIAAVHEAGHAIVASLCTRVIAIRVVDAGMMQPMVEYSIASLQFDARERRSRAGKTLC